MDERDHTRTVVFDDRTESLHLRRFLLTIDVPGEAPRHRIFGRRVVSVGSGPDNDVVIDDPAVSRRHCELCVDPSGYRVVDLGSKNGTRLGDLRVRDAFLRSGTVIGVGSSAIRFETTDDEVEVRMSGRSRFGSLVGASPAMREAFALLERVAANDVRLLLVGPAGVGKQEAAESVHRHSRRRGQEFVPFDCSAASDASVDAELFGDDTRPGVLEQAAKGTVYLAEPHELPTETQARLARALERQQILRGGRAVALDVRVISGAERPLEREVERGTLRSDLYYLLAVVEITLPPLRERLDDLPLLVEHFLERARHETGNQTLNVTYATMEKLRQHAWPGNVAELRNFIDRAVALASPDSAAADIRFVQPPTPREAPDAPGRAIDALMTASADGVILPFKDAKNRLVEAFELEYWRRLLVRTAGNVSAAARIAGVHRKSLEYILKKHELERPPGRG